MPVHLKRTQFDEFLKGAADGLDKFSTALVVNRSPQSNSATWSKDQLEQLVGLYRSIGMLADAVQALSRAVRDD